MPTFFPEKYTTNIAMPRIFCYTKYQESFIPMFRVNRYELFFSQHGREWIKVTLSVILDAELNHGGFEELMPLQSSSHRRLGGWMPQSWCDDVEKALSDCSDLDGSDWLVEIRSQGCHDSARNHQTKKGDHQIRLSRRANTLPFGLDQELRALRHLDCPRYMEKAILNLPLYPSLHNCFTLANVDGAWYGYQRFSGNVSELDEQLSGLHVRQGMKGVPGISKLTGLVTSRSGGIQGYLVDIPAKGIIAQLVTRACNKGQAPSWERREKWCRQLVEIMKEAHSRRLIIGTLGHTLHSAVNIDAGDNLVLQTFHRKLSARFENKSVVPPELWMNGCFQAKNRSVTMETDLFHLGMQLWLIAHNYTSQTRSFFCGLAGCRSVGDCSESHAYPVQLPKCATSIPGYLSEIIRSCRQDDPLKRPPARSILALFPDNRRSTYQDTCETRFLTRRTSQIDAKSTSCSMLGKEVRANVAACPPTTLRDLARLYHNSIVCTRCSRRGSERFWHCASCDHGEYDVCDICFTEGNHCLSSKHYLGECSLKDGLMTTLNRYYTSVQEDGKRKVISL